MGARSVGPLCRNAEHGDAFLPARRPRPKAGEAPTARTLGRGSRFFKPMVWLCLLLASPLYANSGNLDDLIEKYESLLLFKSADYESSDAAKAVFEDSLSTTFRRAVRDAGSFPVRTSRRTRLLRLELGRGHGRDGRGTGGARGRQPRFPRPVQPDPAHLGVRVPYPRNFRRGKPRTTGTPPSCSFASRFLTTATAAAHRGRLASRPRGQCERRRPRAGPRPNVR